MYRGLIFSGHVNQVVPDYVQKYVQSWNTIFEIRIIGEEKRN